MIHTRHFTSSLVIRDNGDGRTLVGPLLPWGVRARVVDRGRLVTETFERGALAGTDPAKVPLTATHPRDAGTLPIGVTVELEERADAAWGAWHVSDTVLGNEVLALARDGVPLGLSVGFAAVPGGSRWSADRQRVTRTSAALDHVAVVRVPAYVGAGVVGVRGDTAPRPTPVLLVLLGRRGERQQARRHEERRSLPGLAQSGRAALPRLQAPHRLGRTVREVQAGASRTAPPEAPMTRSLLRPCLGCGRTVRGRPRCRDGQRTQDQAKNAKRPGFKTYSETQRRAAPSPSTAPPSGTGAPASPSSTAPPTRPPTCRPTTSGR